MVGHVAEIGADLTVDAGQVQRLQLVGHLLHRAEHAAELQQFAAQLEQALDVGARQEAVQRPLLHLQNAVLDVVDDGDIGVDDEVQHAVQDEVGAVLQLQRRGLQLGAQLGMGAGRAVPDGDDIAGPDEDVGLAIPDGVVGLLRRAGDDEELAAIDLDLGHLMRRQRVLDRQGVQMKAPHQGLELLARRLVQADPQVLARLEPQSRIGQRRLPNPLAVLVDIGGDDRHPNLILVGPRSEGSAFSTRRGP
ncbi:hypothetical protein D3C71_674040 [compost metagenome]